MLAVWAGRQAPSCAALSVRPHVLLCAHRVVCGLFRDSTSCVSVLCRCCTTAGKDYLLAMKHSHFMPYMHSFHACLFLILIRWFVVNDNESVLMFEMSL